MSLKHIAFIMDGNRRWAKETECIETSTDHGTQSLKNATQCCLQRKVPYMSVFALSTDNVKRRDSRYMNGLFAFLKMNGSEIADEFKEMGIQVSFVGEKDLYPPMLEDTIRVMEEKTRGCDILRLLIYFCYGGQQEIVHATQRLCERVALGQLNPSAITTEMFSSFLYTPSDVPPPELIIRTGGMQRLSNFLLFQAAYAEFMFTDTLWPRITAEYINLCIDKFATIKRTFGA